MDENVKSIFDQYKLINPDVTENIFLNSYEVMGEVYLQNVQDDLKKKVNPTGPQVTAVPISNELEMNPAQEKQLEAVQSESSTGLDSTGMEGSLESGSTQDNTGNVELSRFANLQQGTASNYGVNQPNTPVDFNNPNQNLQVQVPQLSTRFDMPEFQNPLEARLYPQQTRVEQLAGAYPTWNQRQQEIQVEKQNQEAQGIVIDPVAEKSIIDQEKENYINSLPAFYYETPEDEKKASDKFIKEFTPLDYSKPADKIPLYTKENVIGSDEFDITGNPVQSVADYNANVIKLQNQGLVAVIDNGTQYDTTESGRLLYTITDDDYLKDTNNRVADINKSLEQQRVDADYLVSKDKIAKGNLTMPRTALQEFGTEYYRETGKILSYDDLNLANSEERRNELLATGIAQKNIEANPKLNFDEEYNKAVQKISPFTGEQLIAGSQNLLTEIIKGIEVEDDIMKNNSRNYKASDYSGEKEFFQKLLSDKTFQKDFGKWWYQEGGKEMFTGSETRREANFNTQRGRFDIMNAYEQSRADETSADFEVNNNNIANLRIQIKAAKDKKDVDTLNGLVEQFNATLESNKSIKEKQVNRGKYNDERINAQAVVKREEEEFQKNEADYDNSIIGTTGIVSGTIGGAVDAVKDMALGIPRVLNQLVFKSDAANYYMDEIGKASTFFNVKQDSMFEPYENYKLGNKSIQKEKGYYYEISDGQKKPVQLSSEEKSKLEFVDQGKEFSAKGLFASVANNLVSMVGAEFAGAKVLGFTSKALGRTISEASKVYGAESGLVKSLQYANKLAVNPTNNGVIGWTLNTLEGNYQDAVSRGLRGNDVTVSMLTRSLITGFASKISPDVKFFREAKTLEEGLLRALTSKDKGIIASTINQFTSSVAKSAAKEIPAEIFQENMERLGQTVGEILESIKTGKNQVTNITFDEIKSLTIETAITTAILGGLGGARRGNSFEYKGDVYDISKLDKRGQLSLLANISDDSIFNEFKNKWGVDGQVIDKIKTQVTTLKKYINEIPNKEDYTLDGMYQAGVLLQDITKLNEQKKSSNPIFHSEIDEIIDEKQIQVKDVLSKNKINLNAKTGEELITTETEETPITDEQTTQSAPQPETVQTESATIEGQPEQTTPSSTEGGITINPESQQNEEIQTEQESPATTPEQLDGPTDENSETSSQEIDAPIQDTENEVSEEEQSRINLERLQEISDQIDNGTFKPKNAEAETESSVSIIQQDEQGEQENTQAVSETADIGTSEGNVEVKPTITEQRDALLKTYQDQVQTFLDEKGITRQEYESLPINERKIYDDEFLSSDRNKNWEQSEESKQLKDLNHKISQAKIWSNGVAQGQIENGRITASEAKARIEEYGIPVPKDILEKAEKETQSEKNKNNDTTNPATSQEAQSQNTEERTNITTPDGKQFYKKEDGNWYGTTAKGTESKVTRKNRIAELDNIVKESNVILSKEKNGFTYKKFKDGSEEITSSKGNVIKSKTERRIKGRLKTVKNPQFTYQKAKIFGEYTENQIKEEDAKRRREALKHFIPTNERELALLFFATGGKISPASVSKEIAGNSPRQEAKGKKRSIEEYRWVWFGKGNNQSFESTSESITADQIQEFDQPTLRNELIDVAMSYGSSTEIVEEIVDLYNKSNDPYFGFTEEDIQAMEYNQLPDNVKAIIDSVKAEESMTDDEKFEYEKTLYEKQIQSLSNAEQDEIYNQLYSESTRSEPQNQSVQSSVTQSNGSEKSQEVNSSPEYKQLLKEKANQEARVKSTKETLDRVSKATNQNFQADQENLLGERKTDGGMFDERADGNAGKEVIAKAKTEHDQAKADLAKTNQALRDFENGTNSGTGEIKFQKTNEGDSQTPSRKFSSITKQAFDSLIKRLQKAVSGVFTNQKISFDFNELLEEVKALGLSDANIQRMIKAFHGSPHRFDRFSTEFMGSGEGMQAFGWGLYFTDLYTIAKGYAEKLSDGNSPIVGDILKAITNNNITTNKISPYDWVDFADSFISNNGDLPKVFEQLNKWNRNGIFDEELKVLNKLKSKGYNFDSLNKSKNLYKVSLHKGKEPSQYSWLEWDKPLSDKLTNSILKSNNDEVISLLDDYKDLNSRIETIKQALNSVTKERNLFIDSLKEKYNEEDTRVLQNLLSKEEELKGDESAELFNTLEQERIDLQGLQESNQGRHFYENLTEILGGDKEASLFLLENGIDGVKYPAESISRGKTSETARGFNYVVFDENAATIEEVVEFMKTRNGEIYGAKLPNGFIYINPEKLNANTPIHEFSHLWEQIMPTAWKKGLGIFQETSTGKKLYDQLKKDGNYSNLSDQQLWSEAMNTHIGNLGEAQYQRKPKGKMAEFIDWFKNTMSRFWNTVTGRNDLNKELALSDFTNKVLGDLLGGKAITPEVNPSRKGEVKYKKPNVDFSILKPSDLNADGTIKAEVLAEIEAEEKAIIEQAKSNGTYMKAPNGKATNLNEKQWVQTRTQRFKDWFGDWEVANKLGLIENEKPISVTPNNFSENQIKEIYQSLGEGENKFDNRKVRFVNETLGKLLRHKGSDSKQIIPQLKQIFNNSVPIISESEIEKEGHKSHPNFKGYHQYLGKIIIDGKENYVRFTIQEKRAKPETLKKGFNPNEVHSTFISDVEIYNADSIPVNTGITSPATYEAPISITDTKLQQFFESARTAKENASKVVDENGEPLVLFHGTPNKFSEFKSSLNIGTHGENDQLEGIYFTDNREVAEWYTPFQNDDFVKSVFLNFKNPYFSDSVKTLKDNFKSNTQSGLSDKVKKDGFDSILLKKGFQTLGDQKLYLAFEANQIKSATGNIGTFSEDSNDIRFQIIGEQGATALDKAEESTHRLDNLGVAREMESSDKSAKEIRMATGWERGADKKWRYEIPDIEIKKPFPTKGQTWKSIYDDNISQGKFITLGDMIDGEVLNAYPELNNISVSIIDGLGGRLVISKERGENRIEIGSDEKMSDVQSILIHEIQHAVQELEGFARGGNESVASKIKIKELQDKAYKLNQEGMAIGNTLSSLNNEEWKIAITKGKEKFAERDNLYNEIDKFKTNRLPGYLAYKSIAGETEARNAQTRANMSMTERQATLLSETEDVAREDQIILLNSVGVQESNSGNNNNLIPSKTISEVISEIQTNGYEAGVSKLKESNWYKNLSDAKKRDLTAQNLFSENNIVATLIQNEQSRAELAKERGKEKLSKEKEKSTIEQKDLRKTFRDTISEMKKEYRGLRDKLDKMTNAKERLSEKVFWRKQAVNSIKLLLNDKSIKDKLSIRDISTLLGKAEKIMNARNINEAFDNFESYLGNVIDRTEKRLEDKRTDEEKAFEKYNKIQSEVESLMASGKNLSEIKDNYSNENDKSVAEKAYHRITNQSITSEDAGKKVSAINEREKKMINPDVSWKDRFKKWREKISKNTFDRQWLPKKYLSAIGAKNTENRMVNMAGAASRAKLSFERAYDKIYKGLTKTERAFLDNIIQQKRIIAIDNNRESRDLAPINHPDNSDKNTAQAYLDFVKSQVGSENYKKLEQRAENYFTEFNGLLTEMYNEGLINKDSYDSMSGLDYQPRVFLEHLLDYNENLSPEEKKFQNENGGLTKDLIKKLDEGSTGVLLSNSELLLATAMRSRYQAIMMNRVNKEFITKEFPKAKLEFERLSQKESRGEKLTSKEKIFLKYFKELDRKIIDNPLIGTSKNGNPVFEITEVPQGYKKAYYFENGVRMEFFMESELHDMWHDTVKGMDPALKDKIGTFSGSHLIKAFATGYNPAFVIVNTPRDFLHAINFSSEYSTFIPQAIFQLGKDTFSAVQEIYAHNRGNDTLFTKYIEYGGGMDFLNTQGMLKESNWSGRMIENMTEPRTKDVLKTIGHYGLFKFASNYSEVGFRVAVFKRAIENEVKRIQKNTPSVKSIADLSQEEQDYVYDNAVRQARDLMDFNQGGIWSKNIESVVPYFNAGVQGSRVVLQQFKRNPYSTTMKVLQTTVLGVSTIVGLGMAMMMKIRDDDDDDKLTVTEKYLDFLETLSPNQKTNFFNIPIGYNKEENTYTMLSIAKSQGLTPAFTLTEDLIENTMRSYVGKKTKDWGTIYKNVGYAFTNNMDPTGMSAVFTNNQGLRNLPESGAKIAARNPAMKSILTYATGYDFFFEQPLEGTNGKTLHKFEGATSKRVEEFYKSLGMTTGLSPVRTKAAVESFVTSPTTNPFVGIMYGGLDVLATDKTLKEGIANGVGFDENGEFKFKKVPVLNRAIRETSPYSRQLNISNEVKESETFTNALELDEIMKISSDKIAKRYDSFAEAKGDKSKIMSEIESLTSDPVIQKKTLNRIKLKLQNKDVDGRVWDIVYSSGTSDKAKALLIYSYFGNVSDNKKIKADLKTAGLANKNIIAEYKKILPK